MKKLIITTLLLTANIFANINAVVSILPEKTFVKAIGGDKVNITLMVAPGSSPHTYEPKPSQMKSIAKADLYFAMGVEFENVWLGKFQDLNPNMQTVDLSNGIPKREMQAHAKHACHGHDEHKKDIHTWTTPDNVKIMVENIYKALSKYDPENEAYYKKNLETYSAQIAQTHNKIMEILTSLPKGSKFMVFHPSWGYFAHAYGLEQLSVEIEGKSPKPKELMALMKEAKKQKIQAIFTQPEFSDATAKIIANELSISVIKVSPLNPKWSENLIGIAKAIAGK